MSQRTDWLDCPQPVSDKSPFFSPNTFQDQKQIVKPVYQRHSREPENVSFMSSCLYIQVKIIGTILKWVK